MQRGFGGFGSPTTKANTSAERKPSSILSSLPKPKPAEHKVSENFEPSDTSQLEAGQKVEHQKFGYGMVSKVEGSAHNPIATIQFELQGEKK
jgi:DNA helicase-2/ATP-dependent DNA helicase PcrA